MCGAGGGGGAWKRVSRRKLHCNARHVRNVPCILCATVLELVSNLNFQSGMPCAAPGSHILMLFSQAYRVPGCWVAPRIWIPTLLIPGDLCECRTSQRRLPGDSVRKYLKPRNHHHNSSRWPLHTSIASLLKTDVKA